MGFDLKMAYHPPCECLSGVMDPKQFVYDPKPSKRKEGVKLSNMSCNIC